MLKAIKSYWYWIAKRKSEMMDEKGKKSENTATIRLATEQDYDAVEHIMKQVHRMHVGWRPDIYIDTDPILPYDRYLAHLAEEQVLVAELEGEVVGLLICLVRHICGGPVKEREVLFVDSMAVEEKYRGRGIGHKLFDTLLELCRERKYDGLELQVNARNAAARAMYEKYGFTEKTVNMEFLGFEDREPLKFIAALHGRFCKVFLPLRSLPLFPEASWPWLRQSR